jgi:hypothetical protein
MINSVHARRRLMRWLRCCGWCDEAGARATTSAVRGDTWEPFRCVAKGKAGEELCQYVRRSLFQSRSHADNDGVGTKAGDTPTGTFAICLRAAMRISIGFMDGSASQPNLSAPG